MMSRVLSDSQQCRLAALLRRELTDAYAAVLAAGVPADVVATDIQHRRDAFPRTRMEQLGETVELLRALPTVRLADNLQNSGDNVVPLRLIRD